MTTADTKIGWGYVGGFFDGEGWISLWQRKKRTDYSIGCCQSTSQDIALREIQQFLKIEGIYSKIYIARENGVRRQPVSKLYIQATRANKIAFLEKVIPHLLIKRERAEKLRQYLLERPITNTQYFPEEKERRCRSAIADYQAGTPWKQVLRSSAIAATTLRRFFDKHGIETRGRSGSQKIAWVKRKLKQVA